MTKHTNPVALLEELGIDLEYGCGLAKGRPLRYLATEGLIQIGDDDFDRWANSVEVEFDVWQPKGLRQFEKWVRQ